MTEGIFIAGCAQGPKDIPHSVVQGSAASARVLGTIEQGEIELEPIKASINEEECSGCRICNDLCPFNAITFNEDLIVSEINPALCQGCGTCVAACPAGAISGTVKQAHSIDLSKCIQCGACMEKCKFGAISRK